MLTEWAIERDSEPLTLDAAKSYVLDASHQISTLLPGLASLLSGDQRKSLMIIASEFLSMQQHGVFCDGGKSHAGFWSWGDRVLEDFDAITKLWRAWVSNESQLGRSLARNATILVNLATVSA